MLRRNNNTRLRSAGMYSSGMYSSGSIDTSKTFSLLRHLIVQNAPHSIVDDDTRPSVPVFSSYIDSYPIVTGNETGAFVFFPRRSGGVVYKGKVAEGLTSTIPISPIRTLSKAAFYPLTQLTTAPDLATDFLYARTTCARLIFKDSTVNANLGAAYSGTINGVAVNNLNDLVTTDLSSYPSIATTSKDFIINSRARDGIVMIMGPEGFTKYKQPAVTIKNDVVTRTDSPQLNCQFNTVGAIVSTTTVDIADFWIGGYALHSTATVPSKPLPNDLIDCDVRITLSGTLNVTGASSTVEAQTYCNIVIQLAYVDPSTFNITFVAKSFPISIYGRSLAPGPKEITDVDVVIRKSEIASVLPSGVQTFLITRVVVRLVGATLLNQIDYFGAVSFLEYFDNINGPALLAQYQNFLVGTELSIQFSKYSEGVPSGTLSQYLTQNGVEILNKSDMSDMRHIVNHIFNSEKLLDFRRIYTIEDYNKVTTYDFSAEDIVSRLHSAGLFNKLGTMLSPILSNIPIVGGALQSILPSVGTGLDSILKTTGKFNFDTFQHSIVSQHLPQSYGHFRFISTDNYYVTSFPVVNQDGEKEIGDVIQIAVGYEPLHQYNELDETVPARYSTIQVFDNEGQELQYHVDSGMLEDEDTLKQLAELLGHLRPNFKYITLSHKTKLCGASYGLALYQALNMDTRSDVLYTGVVVEDDDVFYIHEVDAIDCKMMASSLINKTLFFPTANYEEAVNTSLATELSMPIKGSNLISGSMYNGKSLNRAAQFISVKLVDQVVSILSHYPVEEFKAIKVEEGCFYPRFSHPTEDLFIEFDKDDELVPFAMDVETQTKPINIIKTQKKVYGDCTFEVSGDSARCLQHHFARFRGSNMEQAMLSHAYKQLSMKKNTYGTVEAKCFELRSLLRRLNELLDQHDFQGCIAVADKFSKAVKTPITPQFSDRKPIAFDDDFIDVLSSEGYFKTEPGSGNLPLPEKHVKFPCVFLERGTGVVKVKYCKMFCIFEEVGPTVRNADYANLSFNNAVVFETFKENGVWVYDPNSTTTVYGKSWTLAYVCLKTNFKIGEVVSGSIRANQRRADLILPPGCLDEKIKFCADHGYSLYYPTGLIFEECKKCGNVCSTIDAKDVYEDNMGFDPWCLSCFQPSGLRVPSSDDYEKPYAMDAEPGSSNKRKGDFEPLPPNLNNDFKQTEAFFTGNLGRLAKESPYYDDLLWILEFLNATDTMEDFANHVVKKYMSYDKATGQYKLHNITSWVNFVRSFKGISPTASRIRDTPANIQAREEISTYPQELQDMVKDLMPSNAAAILHKAKVKVSNMNRSGLNVSMADYLKSQLNPDRKAGIQQQQKQFNPDEIAKKQLKAANIEQTTENIKKLSDEIKSQGQGLKASDILAMFNKTSKKKTVVPASKPSRFARRI